MNDIISNDEIKYIKRRLAPKAGDTKNLLLFMEEYPAAIRGVLAHSGSAIKWLHSKVVAIPWWWLDE